MPKILHIPNYYLPNFGGIEQVAYDIVSGLKDEYEQKVICFNTSSNTVKDIYDDIEIIRIGFKLKLASQAISLSYLFKLFLLIKKFDPDIIYLHLPNPLVSIYLLLSKIKDRKLIVHWHSDIIDQKILKKFYYPFQYLILKRASKVFATSPNYIESSEDLKPFLNKTDVIPNIVNTSKFVLSDENMKNIEKLKLKFGNKKVLFFLGRHVPYKGIEYIIKASDLLHENAVILIAGEGPLTDYLKRMANGKGNIVFLGRITNDELKEYLAISYLFLFPSVTKNEAFGIALAEALYCGVPAIGFNIEGSGVNWVNKDGYTGFMVENRNFVEFANKINYLLENEKLRNQMSENAKKWINDNFTKNKMISKLKQELKNILSDN